MLLIETYLARSPGKGIGLFVKEKISIGTKYWIRDENFDKIFTIQDLSLFCKLPYFSGHSKLEFSS
jgi:hypothetical protein